MVDGVIGEDTELVARAAGQAAKQEYERVLILPQLMVEMNVKGLRQTQGNVKLRNVLVWIPTLKLIDENKYCVI